ncbi:putative glutamate receptor [Rhipicephalus microplus]|uniref:putative glutamate receptor n=1 Tax=Rhipicephalus microplus TaxID=6941 RepID=UPI003F6D415D
MDEVQMSGPMANLLDLLTENLGFTYTLHSPEDGHWGVPLPNGNWTGLVGMMHNNISDLALGPLVMTYGRSLVTTFSSQVTTDYLTILAGFPNIIHASIFGTLMAFELQVN